MKKPIIDYFPFYRIPAGRYLIAIRKMRDMTADMKGAEALHKALIKAVAEAEAQFDLDMRWRFRKNHRVEHGERAGELDRRLDQLLRGVDEVMASQQRFAEVNPERAAAAEAMSRQLFPSGVTALTQLSFADQANAVFRMLAVYDDNPGHQVLARDLGISENMEAIRELNIEYAREVSAATPPRREEVQAGRRQIALRLGELVARIFGMFPTENPEDQEARDALMEPIERQNEALRALYKRHARNKSAADEAIADDAVIDDDEAMDDDEAALDLDPEDPEVEAA